VVCKGVLDGMQTEKNLAKDECEGERGDEPP
jgi:hypothetical protein